MAHLKNTVGKRCHECVGCIRAVYRVQERQVRESQKKGHETESKSEAHGESEKKMERGVKVIGKGG